MFAYISLTLGDTPRFSSCYISSKVQSFWPCMPSTISNTDSCLLQLLLFSQHILDFAKEHTMRINVDVLYSFFAFLIFTRKLVFILVLFAFSTFVLNLMECCFPGIARSFRSYTCHALCSWISWFLQCRRRKIYPHYNGSHSFPCLGCKLNFDSLLFFDFVCLYVLILFL